MQDLQVMVKVGQETLTISWESGHAWLLTPAGVQVPLAEDGTESLRWVSFWTGDSPSTRREVRVYLDGKVQWINSTEPCRQAPTPKGGC